MGLNQSRVKLAEYILFALAFLLLLTGFILTMVGSGSFSEYYVETIDINKTVNINLNNKHYTHHDN